MSYSAPNRVLMPMRHTIDTVRYSAFSYATGSMIGFSVAWPSANMAIYVPVVVGIRVVVRKLFFWSNSTGTGNVDMGVYDAGGTAVISATEGAKNASAGEQVFDVTDTTLDPGIYYVALAASNNTDTFYGMNLAVPNARAGGVLTEASAYPLPATATWAENQTLVFVPLMGMLLEATPS